MQIDLHRELTSEAEKPLLPLVRQQPATPARAMVVAGLGRVLRELPEQAAYLVPLRVFIGMGWLRAAAEKYVDPNRHDGGALRDFLLQQADTGLPLPFYEPGFATIAAVAAPVGLVVMMTETMIGCAILLGAWTKPALLVAIGLNLNFMLAGQTNPSVFYILVELVLLSAGAGALLGVDGLLRRSRQQASPERRVRDHRRLQAVVGIALIIATAMLPFARTSAPAEVIHDPALVTSLLLLLLVAAGAGLRLARSAGSSDPA